MNENIKSLPSDDDFAILEEVNDHGETVDDMLEGRFKKDDSTLEKIDVDNMFTALKRNNSNKIIGFYITCHKKRWISVSQKIDFANRRVLYHSIYFNRIYTVFQLAWDIEYGYCGEMFGIVSRKYLQTLKRAYSSQITISDIDTILKIVKNYPFYQKNFGRYYKDVCDIAIKKTVTYKQSVYWIINQEPLENMEIDLIVYDESNPIINELNLDDKNQQEMIIMLSNKKFKDVNNVLTLKSVLKYAIGTYYHYQSDDGKGITFTLGLRLFFKNVPNKLYAKI